MSTDVTSGVPQGSVLGPLLFLIYVNDISAGISSSIRLFADDCVVCRKIFDHNDVLELQKDLSLIYSWCTKWKMNLNITKCVHISFTKKMKPFQSQYHLNNVQLKQESTYKYLGIILSSECSWRPQVDTLIAKAGKALNFIQRNLRCSHVNLKRMAYTTCIRPILEYGCVVWDPAEVTFIAALEQLQNRAARFVLGRYGRGESCTAMKAELGWECLSDRRQKQRLKFLYCIYYNKTGINREIYLHNPHYTSKRFDHSCKIREYPAKTNMYANSFFPRTIKQWNRLTEMQVHSGNEDIFYSLL